MAGPDGRVGLAMNGVQATIFWRFAGFWPRCAALFIDTLILLPLIVLLTWMLTSTLRTSGAAPALSVEILISWVYFCVFTALWQATPGKRLLDLRVIDRNGRHPSVGRILLREVVGRTISDAVYGLGFLPVAIHREHRGLHDFIGGTWVVARARSDELDAWIRDLESTLAKRGKVPLDQLIEVHQSQRAALAAEYVRRHPDEAGVIDGALRLAGAAELI
jgi:uncharacterized RDD family membrane protein YckC